MEIKDYKLYIFDMDGLIFDTETLYLNLFPKILKEEGFELTVEEMKKTIGMNSKSCKEHFLKLFPLLNFEKVENILDQKLLQISKKGELKFMKGALNYIKYLSDNNKMLALASSSNKYKIESFLKDNNIYDYFNYIISGEDVKNGKPNPEIFNKVIEKFNIPSKEVVIFEDSINGVIAASKTGAKVVMIPDMVYPNEKLDNIEYTLYEDFDKIEK